MPEQFGKQCMERQTTKMKITQLSPNIGADIDGIDLAKPLTREVIGNIKAAWDQYLVLRFRNQSINDDDLLRFSKYFGELDPPGPNPYGVTFLPEYPEINVISNVKTADGMPNWKSRRRRGSLARRYDLYRATPCGWIPLLA